MSLEAIHPQKKYLEKVGAKQPPKTSVIKNGLFDNHGKKKTDSVDKVSLSTGMSTRQIQELLTSEIGKKVEAMFKEAGIDPLEMAGIDWSPEAVAGRIFDGTTSLFEIWRDQHTDMNETELIDSFEKTIRKSVDQGAQEAAVLIGGLNADDSVTDTASKTMSILHQKYDSFFAKMRTDLADQTISKEAAKSIETVV